MPTKSYGGRVSETTLGRRSSGCLAVAVVVAERMASGEFPCTGARVIRQADGLCDRGRDPVRFNRIRDAVAGLKIHQRAGVNESVWLRLRKSRYRLPGLMALGEEGRSPE